MLSVPSVAFALSRIPLLKVFSIKQFYHFVKTLNSWLKEKKKEYSQEKVFIIIMTFFLNSNDLMLPGMIKLEERK